jgi:ABC-type glycerol-3-phosphate transport system substrate-binding protein
MGGRSEKQNGRQGGIRRILAAAALAAAATLAAAAALAGCAPSPAATGASGATSAADGANGAAGAAGAAGASGEAGAGDKAALKYVMPGPGKQLDSEKVWSAFNEMLREKLPNVAVSFEVFAPSDYKQQFLLLQTSREQMDIANTYTLDFADECRKKTFADLSPLVEKHGQGVKEALPDWLFGYSRVDGKLYSIPAYQMMSVMQGIRTPKELGEQHLDTERLKAAIYKSARLDESFYDVLEEYMQKLKDAGELGLGMNHWLLNRYGFEAVLGNYGIWKDDPDLKITYYFQDEAARLDYAKHAEFYEKGFIRSDALSANDVNAQIGRKGGYVLWTNTVDPWTAQGESEKFGFEVMNVDLADQYYINASNAAGGTGILASSKYPDQAMQALNLLNTDQALYNLLVYGIEGDHYSKTGEDKIETEYIGASSSSDRYGLWKWIVGNTSIAYDTQSEGEGYKRWVFDEVNGSEVRSRLIGFMPDTSKVASKLAQVNAIKDEYMSTLASGSSADWEAVYGDWMDKLDKVGSDEIITELQRQVDEFLASQEGE